MKHFFLFNLYVQLLCWAVGVFVLEAVWHAPDLRRARARSQLQYCLQQGREVPPLQLLVVMEGMLFALFTGTMLSATIVRPGHCSPSP